MVELTHSVRIADIPAEGRAIAIEASESQRQAAAPELGLLALRRLSAEFDIRPLAGGGVAVRGALTAEVVQSCVVTLEPIESALNRSIDLRFLPMEDFERHEARLEASGEDAADGPDVEPLVSESLDLGELLLQELSLALDPYPRTPGAEIADLHSAEEGASPAKTRPFADLDKLMKKA